MATTSYRDSLSDFGGATSNSPNEGITDVGRRLEEFSGVKLVLIHVSRTFTTTSPVPRINPGLRRVINCALWEISIRRVSEFQIFDALLT